MGAPKNNDYGKGRPKGSPNRTTAIVKELFAQILEGEQDHFKEALETLRTTNPKEYVNIMVKLSQRFLPEIQRTELTGQDGETLDPINIIIPLPPKSEDSTEE